jgi:serine/threonine-protein kinase
MSHGRYAEAGQAYEESGQRAKAIEAYKRCGFWRDAGRLLVHEHRIEEAADAFMRTLPREPAPVARLSPDLRRDALHAAACYGRAGDATKAAGILANLGELQRAADALRQAGRIDDAARVLAGSGLPGNPWPVGKLGWDLSGIARRRRMQGSDPKAEAIAPRSSKRAPVVPPEKMGDHLLAEARRLAEAGQATEALQTWMKIPATDAAYKKACGEAIRLAWDQDLMDFEVDRWLRPYLEGQQGLIRDAQDLMPLYTLGLAYESKDFAENAQLAFTAVLAIRPDYRDTHDRLRRLGPVMGTEANVLQRILSEDIEFLQADRPRAKEGKAPAESLPELPGLPGLPEPPPTQPAEAAAIAPIEGLDPSQQDISEGDTLQGNHDPEMATVLKPPMAPDTGPPAGGARVVQEGTVVAQRYRIESMLGRGGMAAVFKATDQELEEDVALKLFDQSNDQDALDRFKQEMKICRRMVHPNIVRTYEFGVWEGFRFITMEIMDGTELEEMIQGSEAPLPIWQGVTLLMQACDGLGYAHAQGIFHRDIKGHNMFVVDGGKTLKIMDFGIAKAADLDMSATRTGMLVGTPAYMSPERLEGKGSLAAGADLYALGVVMYQLFTRTLPFEGPEITTLLLKIIREPPEPPTVRNPDLPKSLEAITLKLLEKKPEDRYESCAELKAALQGAWNELRRLGLDY